MTTQDLLNEGDDYSLPVLRRCDDARRWLKLCYAVAASTLDGRPKLLIVRGLGEANQAIKDVESRTRHFNWLRYFSEWRLAKPLPDVKRCSGCKAEKRLSEFGLESATHDGHSHLCKPCKKQRNSEYQAARERRVIPQLFTVEEPPAPLTREAIRAQEQIRRRAG